MLLLAFFSDKGVPKTGLSPIIDVWEDDATHVVNAQNMTEIAGGFYKYDFGGYDESEEYSIRADGGVALAANDRYVYGTNEVGQVTEDLTDIKGTGFVKDTDSLVDIRPETDKIIYILGLVQENFRLKDQVYNAEGNLTSATIRIYGLAADCDADVSEIAEYTMTAAYDVSGNCTSYKVTKV